jgi:hypothetical protein
MRGERTAEVIPEVTVGEASLICIYEDGIDKEAGRNYEIRLHIYKYDELPKTEETSQAFVNDTLKKLYRNQWPDDKFKNYVPVGQAEEEKLRKKEEFIKDNRQDFVRQRIDHEATHVLLHSAFPGCVRQEDHEILTYLRDVGTGPHCWLRLYDIIKDEFIRQEGMIDRHQRAHDFFYYRVFPEIALQRAQRALYSSPENLIQDMPEVPGEVLQKVCKDLLVHYIQGLRSQRPAPVSPGTKATFQEIQAAI